MWRGRRRDEWRTASANEWRERAARGTTGGAARRREPERDRKDRVFADRYHDRILKMPTEGGNALRYVLGNANKYAAEGRHVKVPQAIDMYSSAPWFDGHRETLNVRGIEVLVRPVTDAKSWMLTVGWRRRGLLSVHEMAATA